MACKAWAKLLTGNGLGVLAMVLATMSHDRVPLTIKLTYQGVSLARKMMVEESISNHLFESQRSFKTTALHCA